MKDETQSDFVWHLTCELFGKWWTKLAGEKSSARADDPDIFEMWTARGYESVVSISRDDNAAWADFMYDLPTLSRHGEALFDHKNPAYRAKIPMNFDDLGKMPDKDLVRELKRCFDKLVPRKVYPLIKHHEESDGIYLPKNYKKFQQFQQKEERKSSVVSGVKRRHDLERASNAVRFHASSYGEPEFYEVLGTDLDPYSSPSILEWLGKNNKNLLPGKQYGAMGSYEINSLDWNSKENAWIITSRSYYTD